MKKQTIKRATEPVFPDCLRITDLTPGQHKCGIFVQNADHELGFCDAPAIKHVYQRDDDRVWQWDVCSAHMVAFA
jgi:hypothetical protein